MQTGQPGDTKPEDVLDALADEKPTTLKPTTKARLVIIVCSFLKVYKCFILTIVCYLSILHMLIRDVRPMCNLEKTAKLR